MRLLIAIDSFKDALTAMEVGSAIERGARNAIPDLKVRLFPLGDGGEGTAEILTWHSKGAWIKRSVLDPLGRNVEAGFGISADGLIAFIEMAQASGLQLLAPNERKVLQTSTFGTGQLIRAALDRQVKRIVLCIGGSATNDIGIGMAGALGYRFYSNSLNRYLRQEELTGAFLHEITDIESSEFIDANKVAVEVLCDVDNPLYGLKGAAYTYAAQKGASPAEIETLDTGARQFAEVMEQSLGKQVATTPGAGAAGGLGAGALGFLDAALRRGIDYVLDYTDFDQALSDTDLVITGEGKIDAQTINGKLISGITKCAKEYNVPVIALCGTLAAKPSEIRALGLQAAFSILQQPLTLAEALQSTAQGLEETAFNVMTTFVGHKL